MLLLFKISPRDLHSGNLLSWGSKIVLGLLLMKNYLPYTFSLLLFLCYISIIIINWMEEWIELMSQAHQGSGLLADVSRVVYIQGTWDAWHSDIAVVICRKICNFCYIKKLPILQTNFKPYFKQRSTKGALLNFAVCKLESNNFPISSVSALYYGMEAAPSLTRVFWYYTVISNKVRTFKM